MKTMKSKYEIFIIQKRCNFLFSALIFSFASSIAYSTESSSKLDQLKSKINHQKESIQTSISANFEKIEEKIEEFLHKKISENSLILLTRETKTENSGTEANISPFAKEITETTEIIETPVAKNSIITGVSCRGIKDFFYNEGVNIDANDVNNFFVQAADLKTIKLMASGDSSIINEWIRNQKEKIESFFSHQNIKKYFSKRTLDILKTDLMEQVKTTMNSVQSIKATDISKKISQFSIPKMPHFCFADILEPSRAKYTVYLSSTVLTTAVSLQKAKVKLYDVSYEPQYLSPPSAFTESMDQD